MPVSHFCLPSSGILPNTTCFGLSVLHPRNPVQIVNGTFIILDSFVSLSQGSLLITANCPQSGNCCCMFSAVFSHLGERVTSIPIPHFGQKWMFRLCTIHHNPTVPFTENKVEFNSFQRQRLLPGIRSFKTIHVCF